MGAIVAWRDSNPVQRECQAELLSVPSHSRQALTSAVIKSGACLVREGSWKHLAKREKSVGGFPGLSWAGSLEGIDQC